MPYLVNLPSHVVAKSLTTNQQIPAVLAEIVSSKVNQTLLRVQCPKNMIWFGLIYIACQKIQ